MINIFLSSHYIILLHTYTIFSWKRKFFLLLFFRIQHFSKNITYNNIIQSNKSLQLVFLIISTVYCCCFSNFPHYFLRVRASLCFPNWVESPSKCSYKTVPSGHYKTIIHFKQNPTPYIFMWVFYVVFYIPYHLHIYIYCTLHCIRHYSRK